METLIGKQEIGTRNTGEIDYFNIPEIQVTYKDNVKTSKRLRIDCPHDIIDFLKVIFNNCMQHHEEVWVIYTNRVNRALGIYNVSKGGLAYCLVDIKMIMQVALKINAAGVILCHNHPSGSLEPSKQDRELTSRLQQACEIFHIALTDSIIITEDNYYSFSCEGIL